MARLGGTLCGIEFASAVRVGGHRAQWVLLRTGGGDGGESGVDAAFGRVAPGASGVWEPAVAGVIATGRSGGQPQAGGALAPGDGSGSALSAPVLESSGGGASDLPLPVKRAGNQRSESGVVQRHHVCADGGWVHVFGGRDGLVESLCAGVGVVQQSGQRVLHSGLDPGAGGRRNPADRQHRSRLSVHQRGVSGGSGIGRGGCEHGWPRALDRQSVHRAVMAQCETGRHLPAGLRGWADGAAGTGALVRGLQLPAAASGLGLCDAGGLVSCAGILRSQARRVAVEIETRKPQRPVLRSPIAPDGAKGSLRTGR